MSNVSAKDVHDGTLSAGVLSIFLFSITHTHLTSRGAVTWQKIYEEQFTNKLFHFGLYIQKVRKHVATLARYVILLQRQTL